MAISDKRKDKLRGKANREARQSANIATRPFRRDIRQANQDFRNTVKSSERASQMLQGVLDQAIKGIKKSGLKGIPKGQLLAEFAGQKVDAAKMVPYETNIARDARSDAIESARGSIADIRAGQALDARTNFKSAIEAVRDRQRQKAEEVSTKQTGYENAQYAVQGEVQKIINELDSVDPSALDEKDRAAYDAQQDFLRRLLSGDEAAAYEVLSTAAGEGVSPEDARAAFAELLPRFQTSYALRTVGNALGAR